MRVPVVVVALLSFPALVYGQDVSAFMERVPGAFIEAPKDSDGAEGRVCLNRGVYTVLGKSPGPDDNWMAASVFEDGTAPTFGEEIIPGTKPSVASMFVIFEEGGRDWAWIALLVDEAQCYEVHVWHGRVWFYQLERLGVVWDE